MRVNNVYPKNIVKYLSGFISLFYPDLCSACKASLLGNENVLCTTCRHSLPLTNFHLSPNNPVEEVFWGRLKIEKASSLLFFDRGSKYRHLIHGLKYKGRKDIGIFLGNLIGESLKNTEYSTADVIIPVPLHKSKLRKRGFNQSKIIADGISQVLQIPVLPDILKRKVRTSTQTKKGRYARWENVEGIFECSSPDLLANKGIILIDDVVTTGATLEAAGLALSGIKGHRLYIATAAYTSL